MPKDEYIGYVYDAPVHYIVLNSFEPTFTLERVEKYLSILDKIEASSGPGVMVTVGSGKRHFSTGFDLPYWIEDFSNFKNSMLRMNEVWARLLSFPMPTIAVFNGNAIAGGYLLGMCHDYRLMNAKVGTICLSELKFGMALIEPYMHITMAKLAPMVATKIVMGITYRQEEALKDALIDDTYSDAEQLQHKLAAFVRRYAGLGAKRMALQVNKQN